MISGCSTVGVQAPKVPPSVSFSDYCPPPQTFADWNTFTKETKVAKGETAFQTVKNFKLAEKEKNTSAQRLWTGMKACRSKKVEMEVTATVTKKQRSVSDILAGGL